MQYTENYNLPKPDYFNLADILNLNDGMDIIDAVLLDKLNIAGLLAAILAVDGIGSGIDSDKLAGLYASNYVKNLRHSTDASHLTFVQSTTTAYSYVTSVNPTQAVSLGLPSKWWHILHMCNGDSALADFGTNGFAHQVAYDLTGTTIQHFERTANGTTWTGWVEFSKVGHTHTAQEVAEPAYVMGSMSNTSKALFDIMRADRLSFLPPDQIIVEVSTDAGVTWVDAGVSDTAKRRLFTGQRPSLAIPLKNGIRSTDCMMRITITGMKYNVPGGTTETAKYSYWNTANILSNERYASLLECFMYVSSSNDRIHCKVETATGAAPNSWSLNREAYLTGWSGPDFISLTGNTFGGGVSQTGNGWNWRFTFRTCSVSNTFVDADLATTSNTQQQCIYHIKASGRGVWTYPNNMMYHDHLYNYDEFQNALFPAIVQGTQLKSTVADGTAPLVVTSKTTVANLGADFLDGQHGAYYLDFANATNTEALYQTLIDLDTAIDNLNTALSSKAPIANPQFTGIAKAEANTSYTTSQLRNVRLYSTVETVPTLANGEIAIVYDTAVLP